MKKYFLFTLFFIIFSFASLNCQETITNKEAKVESMQTFMEVYKIQNTHSEHNTVKVTIYYYPLTKQARIIYDDDFEVFDYLDAVVSLKCCLEDFTKQIGCYHYERYRDDEERNFKFNNKKYTRIISFINFSK